MSFSFWEKTHFINDLDLVIIGSGIVGLTSALYYKRLFPIRKVVVIDRDFLPNGASTKNAGFACLGSATEILDDLQNRSEKEVLSTLKMRWEGLNRLQTLVPASEMNFESCGGNELFLANDQKKWDLVNEQLPYLNELFYEATGHNQAITINYSAKYFGGCIGSAALRLEGALDPGLMMQSLIRQARQVGIELWNGLTVNDLEEHPNSVEIHTNRGQLNSNRVLVCTNGFSNSLFPNLDIRPARAQVLVAKSESALPWKGIFHLNEGYYYFRHLSQQRVLFGGGRQLDILGETTTEMSTTPLIQNDLENILREVILPDTDFSVEYRWAGIMGVGSGKQPIVERVSERIGRAIRMGGMGVAIGSEVGFQAANIWD